jgi:hypothetical protein
MSELDNMDQLPTEGLIDSRFEVCYYENDLAQGKCDSVLVSIFGNSVFKKNIDLNLFGSSMNCEVDGELELIPFGSLEHCVPNSYDLLYSIQEGSQTIYSFRMTAGKDMLFQTVSTIIEDQLKGYRQLLDGKFKINYSEAKEIAIANGVDMDESLLELIKDENTKITGKSSYHWEAELEYDHNSVMLLLIDAMTGKTHNEVLTL